MRTLQREHAEWLKRMYPGQPMEMPAAGMVEEAGELLHALLCQRRTELYGPETRNPAEKIAHDISDAVGDCFIYFVSMCNTKDWDIQHFTTGQTAGEPAGHTKLDVACTLIRVAVDFNFDHSVSGAREYMRLLHVLCSMLQLNLFSVAQETWDRVKVRVR